MLIKKSQITMEFLLLISFLFIMLLGFITVAGIQLKDFSDNQKINLINDFGYSLKRELVLASIVNDGYQRTVTLPVKIDNTINYSITMQSSILIIETEEYGFSAIVPPTQGVLRKGSNIIRKINNSVIIENV